MCLFFLHSQISEIVAVYITGQSSQVDQPCAADEIFMAMHAIATVYGYRLSIPNRSSQGMYIINCPLITR